MADEDDRRRGRSWRRGLQNWNFEFCATVLANRQLANPFVRNIFQQFKAFWTLEREHRQPSPSASVFTKEGSSRSSLPLSNLPTPEVDALGSLVRQRSGTGPLYAAEVSTRQISLLKERFVGLLDRSD